MMAGPRKKFAELYKDLCAHLEEGDLVSTVSEQFAGKTSDLARVQFLIKCNDVNKFVVISDSSQQKSSTLAAQYRSKGNKYFQEKNYAAALRTYQMSIGLAQPYRDVEQGGAKDLSLAYANRSATLFHLKHFEDCLQDIKLALDSGYPKKLHHKLQTRKGHCLQHLGDHKQAIAAYQVAKTDLEFAELDDKKKQSSIQEINKEINQCKVIGSRMDAANSKKHVKCTSRQPALKPGSTNPHFPSFSHRCDVVYHPNKGRYPVAKADIKPGEIVLIEKPFASVLLPGCTASCHHCYKHCYSLRPCSKCSEAMFCSDVCYQSAMSSYHRYECGLLSAVYNSCVGKFGHLALRTILSMDYFSVKKYKQDLEAGKYTENASNPVLSGCNAERVYAPCDYHTIHSLVTHTADRAFKDLFPRAVMAVFLLRCIQKSKFFLVEDEDTSDVEMFVGGLLLSHLQSFPCNAHEITELELDMTSVATSTSVELGAGIYSSLSLFNHSCDPGVTRNFYGDTCVVRAIKLIKQGDEVADNYGAVYAMHTKVERFKQLKPQYFFECQCTPCTGDWPLYPDIPHEHPRWRCDQCQYPLDTSRTKTTQVCSNCLHTQDIAGKLNLFKNCQTLHKEAMDQLLSCDVDAALPLFLEHMQTLQSLVADPWRDFNNCQEAIKQCFCIMGNCHINK